MLTIGPFFFENGEHQTVGFNQFFVVVMHFTIDRDFSVFNQFTTIFTGTETLRLQDPIK